MAQQKQELTAMPQEFGKTDKTYKLTHNKAPISYILATRNTDSFPLLWYDEKLRRNRALRYAKNQPTPFVDEQDENAIVQPIVITDGFLSVPKSNPVLQWFLSLHPLLGKKFIELDRDKEAQDELDQMELEIKALNMARELDEEQIRDMYQLLTIKSGRHIKLSEAKATVLKYAKSFPTRFMEKLSDPNILLLAEVHKFFDYGLLTIRNKKDVFYNLSELRAKMLSYGKGEDYYASVCQFLKTDDGLLKFRLLQDELVIAQELESKNNNY
jgi:hypothetical protein